MKWDPRLAAALTVSAALLAEPAGLFGGGSKPASCPSGAAVPFGYYPTQWRAFPTVDEPPPIVVVMPGEPLLAPSPAPDPSSALPPTPNPPADVPPPVPMPDPKAKSLLPPGPLLEPRAKSLLLEPKAQAGGEKILPPEGLLNVRPLFPDQAATRNGYSKTPLFPASLDGAVPAAVPPFVQPAVLNDLDLRPISPMTVPTPTSAPVLDQPKPKAWLELPAPVAAPVVRGSSHLAGEEEPPGLAWKSAPRQK